ncbi:MAG: ABC transporter ATP-binding protein [Planctomycetes bacterium]|nr:ABC transporter ATP-binding protein [Planctomycetota bacterium]
MASEIEGWSSVDSTLRGPVESRLAAGEHLVAWMVSDIDEQRQYRMSLLALSQHRFFCSTHAEVRDWPLAEIDKLRTKDRGGLGTLELLGTDRRLGFWHYTIAQGPAALVVGDRFEDLKAGRDARKQIEEDDVPEGEESESPPNTLALFRLWQFARPHAFWMFIAFVLSLAATVAAVETAKVIRPLTNLLYSYQSREVTSLSGSEWYLGVMLAGAAVAWILSWGQGAILAWVSERVTADLRNRTYSHLQKLSLEYFGGKRTGDLMSRISSDSDRLTQFLSDSIVDFSANSILLVVVAVALFQENLPLAFVTLLPFPFIVWLMYYSRDKLQVGFQAGSRAWANMTSVLADTIPGIRVVKAFAQEEREIERFRTANETVVVANNRVNSLWTFFWPLITFLNALGVFVVWAYGVRLVLHRAPDFDVGALTAFVVLSGMFYSKLEMMSRMVNASQRAATSAQRIFEILDRVSNVPEPARPVIVGKLRGDLEFRHVGFRYGNRKVIKDFSLKVQAGEMIGLVGHTGAGKSTLINLVCRFFDVAEGAILADGVDIRSYKIEQYRRNVGIVLQDPFLFYGTIAENIAYGRPEATRDEIMNAARAARAHEFILQLADGYDSLVGERGQSLSGGERQRISIARALLIDPRILILDEATSALDSTTERQIQEALQNLVRGRTTIAIAHRLSTLRQANRIMVIERGRLVEIGTHDELLAIDGAYAELHRAQQELTRDIGW